MDFVGPEVAAALCGGLAAMVLPHLKGRASLSQNRRKGGRPLNPFVYIFALLATGIGGLCVHAAKQAVQHGFRVALTRQTLPLHVDENGVVQHKSAHFGQIALGYPEPQYFDVVFDTGSGHVIVPSILCKAPSCKSHRRYKRRSSQTGRDIDRNSDPEGVVPNQPRDMLSIAFGSGFVSGVFVKEYTCLGGVDEREHLLNNGTGPLGAEEGSQLPGSVQGSMMLQRNSGGVERVVLEEDTSALSAAEQRAWERAGQLQAAEYKLGKTGCADMSIVYAIDMSSDPFEDLVFDGIVGLGLPTLSETSLFNFMDVLGQAGALQSLPGHEYVFSVFFGFTGEDSEIIFGGINEEHVDDNDEVTHHPVLDPQLGYWQIKIDALSANGVKLPFCDDGTCRAIWDTGTSLVAVPAPVGQVLVSHLRYSAGISTCIEEDGPKLEFDIGGHMLSLSPADLHRPEFTLDVEIRKAAAGEQDANETKAPLAPGALAVPETLPYYCVPMFMAVNFEDPLTPKTFIFGETVLQRYYAVFNASPSGPAIGFAKSKHTVERGPRPFKTE